MWSELTRSRKRVQKLTVQAAHVMQNVSVANAFRPWLLAARDKIQTNIRTKTDGLESMEYRVLRLDGTLTAHEQHSAALIDDIVEQLDQVRDEAENRAKMIEASNKLNDVMSAIISREIRNLRQRRPSQVII